MSISTEIREQVRIRANYACEFCNVTEQSSGGLLTIDHYRPTSKGGLDIISNLIYCCSRCNSYKQAYFATSSKENVLWNPRTEPFSKHFLALDNGLIQSITPIGNFTLQRLRLNRSALVAFRLKKLQNKEQTRQLIRYKELINLLENLNKELTTLSKEQQILLEEQQELLRIFLGDIN